MMETASTTAPGITPAELTVGKEVDVESRTWAGINKPGGHATIAKIHVDDNNVPTKVDVKYVLGGSEKNVELSYLKMHVELERRGRSRRSDVKMNMETLGGVPETKKEKKKAPKQGGGGAKKKASSPKKNNEGAKKRKALADIDGNNSKVKAAKKAEESNDESLRDVVGVAEPVEEDVEDGEWKLIESGRLADYVDVLTKGQRVAYWWSDDDGWLKGNVSKSLTRVVGKSTIRWTVRVDFDNGDKHTLSFHPLEKRWKVFHSNEKPPSDEMKEEPKKKGPAATKKPAAKKSTKSTGEKKDGKAKAEKKAKVDKKMGEKDKKAKAAKKAASKSSSAGTKSKPATNPTAVQGGAQTKQPPSLSFGPNLQSKIKEISSKMHSSAKTSSEGSGGLVNYSPNSILAVKAAHAKTSTAPDATVSTQSIGYSSSLPSGTLSPDETKKRVSKDMHQKVARAASTQVSLISPQSPKNSESLKPAAKAKGSGALQSKGSIEYARSIKASGSGQKTVMQSLYQKECEKAADLVDYMTGPAKVGSEKSAVASSPESQGDDDLELKLDQERMRLFNTLLSEVFFKQRLDMMDVEEMIEKVNSRQPSSQRPFTPLEIKPFLQRLDGEGRIFLVDDEGKMGAVYAI